MDGNNLSRTCVNKHTGARFFYLSVSQGGLRVERKGILEALQEANARTVAEQYEWLEASYQAKMQDYRRNLFIFSLVKALRKKEPKPPKKKEEKRQVERQVDRIVKPDVTRSLPPINLVKRGKVKIIPYKIQRQEYARQSLRVFKNPWRNRRFVSDLVYEGGHSARVYEAKS